MYPPILLGWTWLLLSITHALPIATLPIPVDRSLNDPSRLNDFVHTTTSAQFDGDPGKLFKRAEPGSANSQQSNPRSNKSTGPLRSSTLPNPPPPASQPPNQQFRYLRATPIHRFPESHERSTAPEPGYLPPRRSNTVPNPPPAASNPHPPPQQQGPGQIKYLTTEESKTPGYPESRVRSTLPKPSDLPSG